MKTKYSLLTTILVLIGSHVGLNGQVKGSGDSADPGLVSFEDMCTPALLGLLGSMA